jgi:hypothetical protein
MISLLLAGGRMNKARAVMVVSLIVLGLLLAWQGQALEPTLAPMPSYSIP